jgi:hypothetical protein
MAEGCNGTFYYICKTSTFGGGYDDIERHDGKAV